MLIVPPPTRHGMETADPWSMTQLHEETILELECQAYAEGWTHIVSMCRAERDRRND